MNKTDQVSFSVRRAELKELPPEDLAEALEPLSGKEQEALFSGLDSETAAEVLGEMTAPQVATPQRLHRRVAAVTGSLRAVLQVTWLGYNSPLR